ncbi:MAG: nitroreductase family deazaflavin-dependent oxidoreductase [Rhodococcus sp.]|nr:nitroreductase family deazaflavin-dependent oxidoreductase [Rhodococcus sp. (in: high G+C Gram-positive bacteria)]
MTEFRSILTKGAVRVLRTRRLMRAPIWLYRARLGFVLGSRFLMLEHIGRKSGATRQVVLEVFGHPEPDTYIVVSGLGARSQWFQNLRANPHARVFVGSRRPVHAEARMLTQDEADVALHSYATNYPRAWEKFKPILEETLGMPIEDQGTPLPLVGLHLTEETRRAKR